MGMPGGFELIIIFLVVLLVFGAKRIPEIARGIGQGIREFKSATSEIKREIDLEDRRSVQAPQQGTPTPRAEASPQAQTGTQPNDASSQESRESA